MPPPPRPVRGAPGAALPERRGHRGGRGWSPPTAAGSWLTARGYGTPERPVAVIAAGERWPDGSLRPALEDLLGAGALISELHAQGAGSLSAEAAAAKAAYEGTADLTRAIAAGTSSRELVTAGYAEDVAIAMEKVIAVVVPVRDPDGAFAAG